MGFYIEGPTQGKSDLLIRDHAARWIDQIDAGLMMQKGSDVMTIVAIYHEANAEIACLAYDLDELQRILHSVSGEIRYLLIEKSEAYALTGYEEPESEEIEDGYR